MRRFASPRSSSDRAARAAKILGLGPLALGLGVTLMVAASGCPGSLENKDQFGFGGGGTGGAAGCGDVPTAILGPRCATANCHDADAPVASLDLTPDAGLVDRIRDVDAEGMTCGAFKIFDSAAPAESLLYTKCVEPVPCGSKMPIGGDVFTSAQADCILEWLETL
jgi:hypothetical protein